MRAGSLFALLCCVSFTPAIHADEAPKDVAKEVAKEVVKEPTTLMAEKGKSLLADDFATPLSADWKVAKGQWEVVDGALKGVEKSEDMHPAVLRRDLKMHNLVVVFAFRLDGGKSTAFSLNDTKGHVCRVSITAAGFSLNKDKSGKTGTDKGKVLDKVAFPMKAGEWHTMTIELCGPDMVATVDGVQTGIGSDAGIDVEKTSLRFPVAGAGVSFKNLQVWEATPKADWEQTKARLLASRDKSATAK